MCPLQMLTLLSPHGARSWIDHTPLTMSHAMHPARPYPVARHEARCEGLRSKRCEESALAKSFPRRMKRRRTVREHRYAQSLGTRRSRPSWESRPCLPGSEPPAHEALHRAPLPPARATRHDTSPSMRVHARSQLRGARSPSAMPERHRPHGQGQSDGQGEARPGTLSSANGIGRRRWCQDARHAASTRRRKRQPRVRCPRPPRPPRPRGSSSPCGCA